MTYTYTHWKHPLKHTLHVEILNVQTHTHIQISYKCTQKQQTVSTSHREDPNRLTKISLMHTNTHKNNEHSYTEWKTNTDIHSRYKHSYTHLKEKAHSDTEHVPRHAHTYTVLLKKTTHTCMQTHIDTQRKHTNPEKKSHTGPPHAPKNMHTPIHNTKNRNMHFYIETFQNITIPKKTIKIS